tara:strand:- start:28 stop:519 length:492 start_codon:yes stop_codon:yes gene_type:complete
MGRKGFTIVELLIVIVVIAILAAITVVAYTGIQGRANDVAVQSDLRAFANKVLQIEAETGGIPQPAPSNSNPPEGFTTFGVTKRAYPTGVHNFYYCVNNTTWAVGAMSSSGTAWQYTATGGLYEYSGTWSVSTTICPTMGVTSFNDFINLHDASSGWRSWVTG